MNVYSGESGAGKTEATKQCLSYLAYLAGSASGIQTKILKASPILEAWGNAKTLRNNNSSRFGKFIEIWFDDKYTISGSSNTTYILEKSRVVFQEKDERNYHVFYQLLKGASPELLAQLELSDIAANPTMAFYINQSGCIDIENVDDAADFREANDAFREVGFTADEETSLHTIVAGILHLGNVVYAAHADNPDESVITPETHTWLERAARQFGVEPEFIKKALLYKMIRSGNSRRTSVAFAPYKLDAAYENKNALAKEIYKRCFDYIVARINALMENDRSQAVNMIGILDIFGFEIFQKVSASVYATAMCSSHWAFSVAMANRCGAFSSADVLTFLAILYHCRIRSSSCASTWPTRRCSSTSTTTSSRPR
jgi:myosin heavy subunit